MDGSATHDSFDEGSKNVDVCAAWLLGRRHPQARVPHSNLGALYCLWNRYCGNTLGIGPLSETIELRGRHGADNTVSSDARCFANGTAHMAM